MSDWDGHVISLGFGRVKISRGNTRVGGGVWCPVIIFEPTDQPHEIGAKTGDPDGPFELTKKDTLITFENKESALVLAYILSELIDNFEPNDVCNAEGEG